jgi:hypothetical protein
MMKDVSGVFSRYFIVGFFVPSFFGLVAYVLAASNAFLPEVLEARDSATFVVVSAAAVLAGLVLLGLNFPVIRLFEGYFLLEPDAGPLRRRVRDWLRQRQQRRFDSLAADKSSSDPIRRMIAFWRLDIQFPPDRADVLPTRLGNAVRAFELHGQTRWGLSAIAASPRIDVLLSDQERQLHADAQSEFAFFLNGAVASLVLASVLAVDGLVNRPHPFWLIWIYAVPPLLGYLLYRGAVTSAERWGERVRASIDLHRLELYRRLGVREPASAREEREIAAAVNDVLLWGVALPDAHRAQRSSGGGASGHPGGASSGGGTSGHPGRGA